MAPRAYPILSPAMLPLVSRTIPRLTGTRSALKCVTSTRRSSSYTVKSPWFNPATNRPVSSVTVAVTLTRSTPLRNCGSCPVGRMSEISSAAAAARTSTAWRQALRGSRSLEIGCVASVL